MGILTIREDCWIWLELPMVTKHDLLMRRLPRDVKAFGSMRLCLREAWKRHDEQGKRRTAQNAAAQLPLWQHSGSTQAAVRQHSGSTQAALRQRFDTAAIFSSASTAVPIPVFHAVESAVAFTAVRQGLTRGSLSYEWSSSTRFRKQVANCNLNRS